jgi:hypothetical protein
VARRYGLQNRVTLRWIPAHIGVPGNEQADEAGKEGATEAEAEIYPKTRGGPVRLAAVAKQAVRPTHRLIPEPSRKVLSLWAGQSKPHAVILIQMRTQRIGLRHFFTRSRPPFQTNVAARGGS